MKDRNDKQKFKESKIGKIIYGFLLFMPLFAIGVTCGYAMINKNAKDSYYGSTINDYETLTTNKPVIDKEYKIVGQVLDVSQSGAFNKVYYISNGSVSIGSYDFSNIDYFRIYSNASGNIEILAYTGSTQTYDIYLTRDGSIFTFTLSDITTYPNGVLNSENYSIFEYIEYNKVSFVSEVFYYSIDRVTQSNLFNWVTTSNIYTGMHNFTTAMSVTNTFIPMLLTYWLIISVIYFLYDMVLILLTVLHRKIHNLQDSV